MKNLILYTRNDHYELQINGIRVRTFDTLDEVNDWLDKHHYDTIEYL
jgi:hypothetical protein